MSEGTIIGAFSEEQACQLSGVSLSQLRRWDADGFFQPAYGSLKHVPFGRVYSFRDIVSLRILNDLRNRKRIPLRHLREVSDHLSHFGDAKWTATTLYVLGRRVVFDDPRTKLRQEVVSGQRVFDIPLRVVIANTRRAVLDLNKRDSEVGQIRQARFISYNMPVIAGTRVPVSAIQDFANAGYTTARILREYPDITAADVEAALAYKSDSIAA